MQSCPLANTVDKDESLPPEMRDSRVEVEMLVLVSFWIVYNTSTRQYWLVLWARDERAFEIGLLKAHVWFFAQPAA